MSNSKFFYVCMLFAALVTTAVVSSCGSNWTIEGNNMIIHRVCNDTIAPAGSYIMYPDSVRR